MKNEKPVDVYIEVTTISVKYYNELKCYLGRTLYAKNKRIIEIEKRFDLFFCI